MRETVAAGMPDTVRLQAGDLRSLDFEDDKFELIVCFEVIEHFEDPFTVLDELVRVLAPGGLLLVSSPNRGVVSSPGIRTICTSSRPPSWRLSWPSGWTTCGCCDSTITWSRLCCQTPPACKETARPSRTLRCTSLRPTVRVTRSTRSRWRATRISPKCRELAAMNGTLELREWLSVFETQAHAIADKDNYIDELTARLEERDRLAQLLGDAEHRLAEVPELNLRIADLEFELAAARSAADAARREARAGPDAHVRTKDAEVRQTADQAAAPSSEGSCAADRAALRAGRNAAGAVRQPASAYLPDLQVPGDLLCPLPDPDLPAAANAPRPRAAARSRARQRGCRRAALVPATTGVR